jgi:hypothetical protein
MPLPNLFEAFREFTANLQSGASDGNLSAREVCDAAAPLVGAATGNLYANGTLILTDNPEAADMVGDYIGAFVTDGWSDVCALPENLGLSDSSPGPDFAGSSSDGISGGS